MISATLCAPWPSMRAAGIAAGATGIFGLAYVVIVIRRARRQHDYQPVLEDVIWHMILPFAAYLVMLAAWALLAVHETLALFGFAGGTILLLFIGIHNAWDTVTFIAIERIGSAESQTPAPAAPTETSAAASRPSSSPPRGADDEPIGP
jgi:hypothetical protein